MNLMRSGNTIKMHEKHKPFCRKFTFNSHIRPRNATSYYVFAGIMNTTFIFSWYLTTFGPEFAFRLRGVMAICANINFYNEFDMHSTYIHSKSWRMHPYLTMRAGFDQIYFWVADASDASTEWGSTRTTQAGPTWGQHGLGQHGANMQTRRPSGDLLVLLLKHSNH